MFCNCDRLINLFRYIGFQILIKIRIGELTVFINLIYFNFEHPFMPRINFIKTFVNFELFLNLTSFCFNLEIFNFDFSYWTFNNVALEFHNNSSIINPVFRISHDFELKIKWQAGFQILYKFKIQNEKLVFRFYNSIFKVFFWINE